MLNDCSMGSQCYLCLEPFFDLLSPDDVEAKLLKLLKNSDNQTLLKSVELIFCRVSKLVCLECCYKYPCVVVVVVVVWYISIWCYVISRIRDYMRMGFLDLSQINS